MAWGGSGQGFLLNLHNLKGLLGLGSAGGSSLRIFNNLEDGPLSALKAYGMRVNRAKVDLPFGGEIVPSTSGAASKDGGKETFVVFDETHLYNNKQLHQMYDTVSRNLNKRKRQAEPWALETTTMYGPRVSKYLCRQGCATAPVHVASSRSRP